MQNNSSDIDALEGRIHEALALIHAGRLSQADAMCRQVLTIQPGNFNALQLLGHIALRQCEYAAATKWLGAAASANPTNAAVYSNLAVALLALGRPQEALEYCERALSHDAASAEALCNRGNALRALDRPQEALASYERAIVLVPTLYLAHAGRANALLTLRRHEEALGSIDRALQIAPRSADVWCTRGIVLLGLRRLEESLADLDRSLSLSPETAETLNNRGTVLRRLKRPVEAIASYERALRKRPDFAEALCNLANIRLDCGEFAESLLKSDQALRLQPELVDAWNVRGLALRALNRNEEAAETFGKLVMLAPCFDYALANLFMARANLCMWQDRADLAARIMERVDAGERASSPQAFLSISDSAAAQLRCARTFVTAEYPIAAPLWRDRPYERDRLRLAYLSSDFHDHPVAHLIAGVVERHDPSRFETFGFSLRETGSGAMQTRMRSAFQHFEDVSQVSDRSVAARMRELEIDIAIDLTGHTRGGRLGILAFRPAPVQVNYLGFAGTSGASYVDYVIGDDVSIPVGQEEFFSERIVRLPHSFLPNDMGQSIDPETPQRRDLGLPDAGFVFCAFNNTYKVNPPVFDIWMRLLKETPGSVLWLRHGESALLANLEREAIARGVAPERLVFAAKIPAMGAHLARYRQADLFLDTLPYGAHATARDALWAGLPVLTCAGNTFAGRVAASLLAALDIPELVTASLQEYEMRALAFAHSPILIAEVRAKLAHQRAARPLFDTDLYRRHLESAYITMWEHRRRGDPNVGFSVPAIR